MTRLRGIYKKFGIKYKRIKYSPAISEAKQTSIDNQLEEVTSELLRRIGNMEKVIFIDEVTFSSHTRLKKTWSLPKEEFIIQKKALYFPVVACVGAIDEMGQLLQFSTFEKSVNVEKFLVFLEDLGSKVELRGATMFLDNLRVHHSHIVKAWAAERGLHLLFNAPYSCTFNPIETLWAFSKRRFY